MRSFVVFVILVFLLGALSATSALGQKEVYIYRGAPLSQSGIAVGNWGSGRASESTEHVLAGSQAIKILTQGLYAGGRLEFAQPVALFTGGINPKHYVVFTFFFNDVQTVDLSAQTGNWYDIDPYTIPRAARVRFVFESDSGLAVSAEQPTGILDPDDNWLRVAVPLAKLGLPEDITEFRLKRLVITTDGPGTATTPATMFLGEAKLVEDDQPIKVDPIGSQTIALGDEVVLVGEATGGVSSLKYSWDWDARNGVQDETLDRIGRCTYTRGGDYTVTLTVSDIDGLKKPVSVTGKITVID
jgi:hypothetical protein